MSGFVMLGASDVPVCEDGVCVVPSAEQVGPVQVGAEQVGTQQVSAEQVSAEQVSAEAPPR
ncbi:hypothetical protein [Rathayibacter sp. VKM Ac-2759]|uniref:hypothetical protein n=1 Tax=Rathayibacter sp. VKM Ac-2759 TaxID=2609252 RepID=UPI0024479DD3|nr:hypothetical protein [Rathayibacter sp. VKM Ac-2759]